MVCVLIKGLPPLGPPGRPSYHLDSFGVRFQNDTSRAEAERVGKKFGFTVGARFSTEERPNCYVKLDKGKSLLDIARDLLTTEPKVMAVNLSWIEY